MLYKSNTINWRTILEEILINLYKKVYFFMIGLLILLFVGLSIQNAVINNKNVGSVLGILFAQLFVSFCFLLIIFYIKSKKLGDYFFCFLVISIDFVTFIISYIHRDDESHYIRILYHFICYGVMIMNLKLDITWPLFIFAFTFKIIFLIGILVFYNFKNNIKNNLVVDIYMILFGLGMILSNKFFKNVLFDTLEKLNNKNLLLTERFKNILNTMKSPLVSINISEKLLFFNLSFTKFIIENFDETAFKTNILLDEVDPEKYSIDYLEDLRETLTIKEKELFDKIKGNVGSEIKDKLTLIFYIKLLILNKIFKNFLNEDLISFGISEYFNFLSLILGNKLFKEKENFELIGEFKISSPLNDNVYEISWRKSIFEENSETVDILLNDITSVKNGQFMKADVRFRKKYLFKIGEDLITPIKSLINSIKDLSTICNTTVSNTEINKEIALIEGYSNHLSILVYNINDYCKDINDFDFKINLVDIRGVLHYVFQMLECLIKMDENKKENIKLFLNIDENLPKSVNTDERRLKQILVNLISNSVKYTNFGYIKLNAECVPKQETNDVDEVKITVEDSGIGISKEEQAKIFSNNFNLNRDYFYSENINSGLGLVLCKKIIQKIGKNFNCESFNQNTRVYFSIFDLPTRTFDFSNVGEAKPNYLSTTIEEDFTRLLKTEGIERPVDKPLDDESVSSLNKKILSEINLNIENKKDAYTPRTNKIELVVPSERDILFKKEKHENVLINLFQNQEFCRHKINFLKYNRPLIMYINRIIRDPSNSKYILIIDDELKHLRPLKLNLKEYIKEKGLSNTKVIKLNDGMEALLLLCFDLIFFGKVRMVISDLEMNILDGDTLFKMMNLIMKKLFKDIHFVLYYNPDENTSFIKENGINNLLKKPCTKSDLEKLLIRFNL